jgi:type IV pilus assembly protein PilB
MQMFEHDDFAISALLEEGKLTPEIVATARKNVAASEKPISISDALIAMSAVSAAHLAVVRAQIAETPYVNIDHYTIDLRNSNKLPKTLAESIHAFPLFLIDAVATVGMVNPLDLRAVDQLRAVLRCDVEPVLCDHTQLQGLIERAYALSTEGAQKAVTDDSLDLTTGKEPIVIAVNQIIATAVERAASDIHLGPDETNLHLRYRIDGHLVAQQGPSLSAHGALVQRLKVMANLDLTQTRRPQDGKFRFNHNGRAVDIRISFIPTVCGENVVMRLLTSAAAIRGFSELGLPTHISTGLEEIIDAPHGMLLVTGPTGSGKTTTLYTALKKLNNPQRNVMTIEDPVEIRMPLIRQVQVNHEIGMTFAGALRSMLRQDPDVVMVGEIRDEETARIAVQAALTGHLVLSTLHTNDACGAVPRLRDFNCPSFAINAALLGVLAQRLVRRVCRDCSKPDQPAQSILAHFGAEAHDGAFVAGAGCARCGSSGFLGRVGVYELFKLTQGVQHVIETNGPINNLRAAAQADGFKPMWHDGLHKAKLGITTLQEVLRVVAILRTAAELQTDTQDQDATPARLTA